jgi:hypothetical protein
MDRFDSFLKALLKALFRGYPYDEDKSKRSFEIIKNAKILNMEKGENDG